MKKILLYSFLVLVAGNGFGMDQNEQVPRKRVTQFAEIMEINFPEETIPIERSDVTLDLPFPLGHTKDTEYIFGKFKVARTIRDHSNFSYVLYKDGNKAAEYEQRGLMISVGPKDNKEMGLDGVFDYIDGVWTHAKNEARVTGNNKFIWEVTDERYFIIQKNMYALEGKLDFAIKHSDNNNNHS